MKFLKFLPIMFCFGSAAMPEFFKAAEDIVDNNCINVEISKDALVEKDTDTQVEIRIMKKDQPIPVPPGKLQGVSV